MRFNDYSSTSFSGIVRSPANWLLFDGVQTAGLAQATFTGYLRLSLNLTIPTYPFPHASNAFDKPSLQSFSVFLVHCAFVYRVWLMSDKRCYMAMGLVSLVLIRFGASMGLNITIAHEKTALKLHNHLSNAFGAAEMATAALFDVLIAIAMALYLSRERSEFLWTNMLISKLITYFVGIGALTSIFALLTLFSFITMPQNLVFLIFHSVLSKLYGNSLLVILIIAIKVAHSYPIK
ncbi:hypothetical protein ONZ45_g10600 [Pleurotus djamor]|nr:hypothetical protein ONZ45_g10600 [Pleurotus djamor]